LQPAKLGARLAQAFSTTEPSITLEENEIEIVDDIAPKEHLHDYQFTDGYGCISLELAAENWRIVNPNRNPLPKPAPAAYQVSNNSE
jgi:RNA-dependent RNA polymerase